MCRFYFKYRCAAKSNALQNIEWQPALLNHPIQNDSYNCGVFVLQVSIVTDYDGEQLNIICCWYLSLRLASSQFRILYSNYIPFSLNGFSIASMTLPASKTELSANKIVLRDEQF